MDYIVMDLEWNQNPYGKNNHHPDIPFEIIEIGAVRVTEDREITDSYQQVIRPRVYKRLHYKIQEITHFTEEELSHGKDFKRAIVEFLEWCGDDYMFCTWGSMDLTELQKNMRHYKLERILEFPLFYVDLQKMFSLRYDDGHMKRTLTSAVEYLEIPEENAFHRALSDAYYTAKVMQVWILKSIRRDCPLILFMHQGLKRRKFLSGLISIQSWLPGSFLIRKRCLQTKM